MDDPLQELEHELKALRPRRPSVLLRARLDHELGDATAPSRPARRFRSATSLNSWKWLSWRSVAAAAGLAFVVSIGVWRQAPPAPTAGAVTTTAVEPDAASTAPANPPAAALAALESFRPVKAANVLYDLQDEGATLLPDNTPARRVRARYVDTYTWRNPATNSSLKWSVPRDEVRVLPASFH